MSHTAPENDAMTTQDVMPPERTSEAKGGGGVALHAVVRRQFGDCTMILADCLDVLPEIKCDAVVTDPPYGVTANHWDDEINLSAWWSAVRCACNGAIVITAQQPFATDLINSNRAGFKYDWVWDKVNKYGRFLQSSLMPLRRHELVLVFGDGAITYNPQMVNGEAYLAHGAANRQNTNWGTIKKAQVKTVRTMRHPHSILAIPAHSTKPGRHPTQKPTRLMRYLVETYSNPGNTVCDPFMGSGTTAIACVRTGRKFVGIEKDERHFETACERVANELAQGVLLPPNDPSSATAGPKRHE